MSIDDAGPDVASSVGHGYGSRVIHRVARTVIHSARRGLNRLGGGECQCDIVTIVRVAGPGGRDAHCPNGRVGVVDGHARAVVDGSVGDTGVSSRVGVCDRESHRSVPVSVVGLDHAGPDVASGVSRCDGVVHCGP
ncbi:MAG: hypothetical protein AB8A46_08240 [Prochlorococcus sp.]